VEFLSAKAMTIAVGVAVSLTIASAILFTLNQITLVYKGVYSTDVSIKGQFTEFAMYDGTVMTGLDMYNTAKKYKYDGSITVIHVRNSMSGSNDINSSSFSWISGYNASNTNYANRLFNVNYINNDDIITITFVPK